MLKLINFPCCKLILENALDRVRHDVLFKVLETVGLGAVILQGVRMAYKGCSMRLIRNNCLSAEIFVFTSIKKGCPISLILFALSVELYCLSISADSNIHGFNLMDRVIKLLAYADDVATFCTDKRSVSEAVSITRQFCGATGSA